MHADPSMVASSMDPILRAVVSISILIFFGKIFASIFSSMKLPEVVGEILAGILFGPFALGSGIVIFGEPLVVLNDYVDAFAEIGAIMILFSMGLEMGLASLRRAGAWSALVATFGAVIPFVAGYQLYIYLGYAETTALFIGAVMVATSLAISARILEDLDALRTDEGVILINAAVIDDIIGVAILAVVASILTHGGMGVQDIVKTVVSFFVIWLIMVAVGAYVLPRLMERFMSLEVEGAMEAAAIASAFILAAISGSMGLSPIVGSYAAGMAIAESRALPHVKDFIRHINMIFSPIFFTVIGAKVNLGLVTDQVLIGILVMTVIAAATKFTGCFAAAMVRLKNALGSARVGIGMIPRGELGLIIAGMALSKGVVSEPVYVEAVGMVILTSIIAPIILSRLYRVEEGGIRESEKVLTPSTPPPPTSPQPDDRD